MFKNKKRAVIFTVIVLVVLGLIIRWAIPYRFGYFTEGPKLAYEHFGDVLKLENGNVLILGSNSHFCKSSNDCKDNIMPVVNFPCLIYDAKSFSVKQIEFPTDILYQPKGILLKNNKLLLTHVYNPNDTSINYPKIRKIYNSVDTPQAPPYQYDSMAILNLNTLKIEQIIKKEINRIYRPNWFYGETFTLLDNDKILIIDFNNSIIETYDLKTNTTKILPIKIRNEAYSKVFATSGGTALIFGKNLDEHDKGYNIIYKYDDKTQSITPAGKAINRHSATVKQINNYEFIIFGGNTKKHIDADTIEVFNAKNAKTSVLCKLKKRRLALRQHVDLPDSAKISSRHILIVWGHKPGYGLSGFEKTSEIIDIKSGSSFLGPKLIHAPVGVRAINLNKNEVMLLQGNTIQIFRKWRWIK